MEYDDEYLSEVNENVDLLEYVSSTYNLKQKGKDYFMSCPLHFDKTPSMSITPSRNCFYCHSCGVGGGIIGWLMHIENMKFYDAVEKASQLANMDMSTMCQSMTVKLLRKLRKLKQTGKLERHVILEEAKFSKYRLGKVTEWLVEGIRQSEMDLFEIRIDDRSNRIVYPVRDIEHNLINIKGRTRYSNYKEMGLMKYINYFSVGEMDYLQSLYITLPYVKKAGEIILFESIKSVMKAYGWGYKNTASVENHSLTDEQIRLLIRLHVDVVIAYDSDVSYRSKNIVKAINKLKRFTNVYVIEDKYSLLGGAEAKNSPVDCGFDTFVKLYEKKRRIL